MDKEGTLIVDDVYAPKTRTVASSENTAELRGYLERVVTSGSATATFMDGYRIGGKTGTAQKVVNGVYGKGKYISSFAGMAPVDDPKVTLLVTVDEPSPEKYYAGQVAVPYAKEIFTDIFNYLDSKYTLENENSIIKNVVIPEVRGLNLNEAKKIIGESKLNYEIIGDGSKVLSLKPYPGYTVKEGTKVTLETDGSGVSKELIMPQVTGYSLGEAEKMLDSLGIKYVISGNGIVSEQSIPKGELIEKGITIVLKLNSDYKD